MKIKFFNGWTDDEPKDFKVIELLTVSWDKASFMVIVLNFSVVIERQRK